MVQPVDIDNTTVDITIATVCLHDGRNFFECGV